MKNLISTSVWICLAICSQVELAAQTMSNGQKPPDHIRFSVTTTLHQSLDLHHTGTPLLQTSPGLGVEGVVSYSRALGKGFRVQGGVGMGIYAYTHSYHFTVPPGGVFDTPGEEDVVFTTRGINMQKSQHVLTLPVSLQKSFQVFHNKDWHLNVEGGIKWNIKQQFPFSSSVRSSRQVQGEGSFQYFDFHLESTGAPVFVSYTGKIGLQKQNAFQNTFLVHLVYQYAPAIIGSGDYAFYHLGFESAGTVKQNANYIGLELAYGLALHKRK